MPVLVEMPLESREQVTSLNSVFLLGRQYLTVGTALFSDDEMDEYSHGAGMIYAKEGKMYLLEVRQTGKDWEIAVKTSYETAGAVHDTAVIHGFLAVASASKVSTPRSAELTAGDDSAARRFSIRIQRGFAILVGIHRAAPLCRRSDQDPPRSTLDCWRWDEEHLRPRGGRRERDDIRGPTRPRDVPSHGARGDPRQRAKCHSGGCEYRDRIRSTKTLTDRATLTY